MQKLACKIAMFLQRHPLLFMALVIILVLAAIPGVFLVEVTTDIDLFIDRDSPTFITYERYQDIFGGEPIVALLEGNVAEVLAQPENRDNLSRFEEEILADPRYDNILGPMTFLMLAVEQMPPPFQPEMLNNPDFVRELIFDNQVVEPEFAPVIPRPGYILITLVPSGDITIQEMGNMVDEMEERFQEEPVIDAEITVSGQAAALQAVNEEIRWEIVTLLAMAVAAMVVVLYLIFRVRWRLLPLLMVLIAALWTFGLMGYLGIPLSMATLGVLPIIIGLGIDYSVQFQNRYEEELRRKASIAEALESSIAGISQAVGIAWAATTIGFLTLMISDVPMVRDFGILLILGIFLSYLVAFFLLNSILAIRDRKASLEDLKAEAAAGGRPQERILAGINRRVARHPFIVWSIAIALFLAGAGLDHTLQVETSWEELVPEDIETFRELSEIRQITGYAGEVIFMIEDENMLDPEILAWMLDFGREHVDQYDEFLTVSSPASLIAQATEDLIPPDEQQAEMALTAMPAPLVQRVINPEQDTAVVSFQVVPIPMEELYDIIEEIEADVEPPAGITVTPTGNMVMGSETIDAVLGTRLPMIIAGVLGVFVALLLIYRSFRRAIFVVLPMVLVIGWSSAAMRLFGIPINPLTAVLAAIIIGIATEYAVLLMERYQEELDKDRPPRESMITASSNLGRAIVVSALTTLAGFVVLIASTFPMVRDFGIVTITIVFMALVAVIIVLPPLVVWFDDRRAKKTER